MRSIERSATGCRCFGALRFIPRQHQRHHQQRLELPRELRGDGLGVGAEFAVGDEAALFLAEEAH